MFAFVGVAVVGRCCCFTVGAGAGGVGDVGGVI